MRKIPVPSARTLIALAWLGAVLVVVFIIAMLFLVARLSTDYKTLEERADRSRADRDDLRTWVSEQDRRLEEANRKLIKVGERPVETDPSLFSDIDLEDLIGPAGPAGQDGTDGADGVDGIRGPAGRDGRDGASGLRGAVGPAGPMGPAGPAGPAGPRGPDPACFTPPEAPCKGEDGADGADGVDGEDGEDAFPFTFSFTVEHNPAQSTTYTVTCTLDGCTVTT